MDQLYDFSGPLRSMTIEKSLFKRLGPFWKEQKSEFLERREFDSQGRLIVKEIDDYKELYSYLAEGGKTDFRRAALYRFGREGSLLEREIWHYRDNGTLRGKEIHSEDDSLRLVEIEEDREKGILIEKEESHIRGRQVDREGRISSEYVYNGSEADMIVRYAYDAQGRLAKREETDREGIPFKTTHYRYGTGGLLKEAEEQDQKGTSLYHRVFEYPGGEDRNWLIREEYALNGRGNRIPLSVIYRSLNFFHEPRLVEDPPPPSPKSSPPTKEAIKEGSEKSTSLPQDTPPRKEQGTRAFSNGYYRGDLIEGRMEGRGIFTYNDGSIYKGDFRGDKPEGRGELQRTDGSCYQGDFKAGLMHGKGRLVWADGSCYEGPFKSGLMEGIGVFTWPGGDRFKGLFEKGRRTDQGLVERNG
ncbi:MAG: hypothetical protein PQJ59_06410 [Spirochaetales bacterium]|nr:hypothetical protein [Spirochaetales bacterium]